MNSMLMLASLFGCAAIMTATRPFVSGFMMLTAITLVVAIAVAAE